MKFLIIGGAGFIGYHLASYFSENKKNKVDIIDNLQRGVKDPDFQKLIKKENVNFIKINFENINVKNVNKNYNYIFHLASIVGVDNVVSEPEKVLKQNINLIYKIVEISKLQKNLKKICFTSTSEVYANSVKFKVAKVPTKEQDLITINNESIPRDSYFLSKLISEKILVLSKLPFIITRLHNIYGPRMGFSHVIPEIFSKIKKKTNSISVFSHSHSRAFCYISDAINQIKSLTMNNKVRNIVVNIGNDQEEIKIINLVKKILKILKIKKKIINKGVTVGSPKRRCPNMKLNYSLVKKKPSVDLDDGLNKTFDWYKDYL